MVVVAADGSSAASVYFAAPPVTDLVIELLCATSVVDTNPFQ